MRTGGGGLGLVVLGTGRVVGRRRMPQCMIVPKIYGPIRNLIPVPKAMGVEKNLYIFNHFVMARGITNDLNLNFKIQKVHSY